MYTGGPLVVRHPLWSESLCLRDWQRWRWSALETERQPVAPKSGAERNLSVSSWQQGLFITLKSIVFICLWCLLIHEKEFCMGHQCQIWTKIVQRDSGTACSSVYSTLERLHTQTRSHMFIAANCLCGHLFWAHSMSFSMSQMRKVQIGLRAAKSSRPKHWHPSSSIDNHFCTQFESILNSQWSTVTFPEILHFSSEAHHCFFFFFTRFSECQFLILTFTKQYKKETRRCLQWQGKKYSLPLDVK